MAASTTQQLILTSYAPSVTTNGVPIAPEDPASRHGKKLWPDRGLPQWGWSRRSVTLVLNLSLHVVVKVPQFLTTITRADCPVERGYRLHIASLDSPEFQQFVANQIDTGSDGPEAA